MSNLEFSLNLPAPTEDLIRLSEDFDKLPVFLPDQLKSVKIIDKNEDGNFEVVLFDTNNNDTVISNLI